MPRKYLEKLSGFIAFLCVLPAWAGTLADVPLNTALAVPANVLFPLSVEWPTGVSAAYRNGTSTSDNTYDDTQAYRGYFDADKCYSYTSSGATTATPSGDTTDYFYPVSAASDHQCSGTWSGNFLNWATMTGLDEFRWAMTGGNRAVDTAALTVLRRAYVDNHGSTSYFPRKNNLSGAVIAAATPFPSTVTLQIDSAKKGVQMQVTTGGSGTALCQNPQLSGGFSCSLVMQGTNETGTCNTWGGSGTSGSPYLCTSFGAFNGSYAALGAPTGVTNGTSSTFSTSSSETVTCSGPSGTSSSNFNCTLTDSSGNTGSCLAWTGDGNSTGTPFRCTNFGTFAGATFSVTSNASASSYVQSQNVNQSAAAASSCSLLSSPRRIRCTLAAVGSNPSRTTTCTTTTGSGNSSRPYRCSNASTWTFSPTASYVSFVASSSNSGSSGSYYRAPTSVTYSIPVDTTYYYTPSYTGSDTASNYYYSTYGLTFGGAAKYFNVQAKVCDSSVGIETNCVKHGTSYKPEGSLQKYGETMRFGVFSYYNSSDIDNAVMRSKLKYIAPLKWTSTGTATSNTAKEWSSSDGTLVTNPDAAEATASYGGAVSDSGVINYLNKFGYTPNGSGYSYKSYDDVGKLYYESLRYLRGLQPTSAFYTHSSSITGANDGFPIITTWDDPVQHYCQKNFIIAMGDIFSWCDKRLPGGTSSTAGSNCSPSGQTADVGSLTETGSTGSPAVNARTWTNTLGTKEGWATNLGDWFHSGRSNSFYMSGLAYWAAYNGFRTFPGQTDTMKAKTFVIDVQENGYPGVCSQYWYAAKYGGADSFDASGNPLNWCKNPSGSGSTCVNLTCPTAPMSQQASELTSGYPDNMPKTLLPAGNPDAMIKAVDEALASIAAQNGVGAGVGLSTGDLRTGNGTNLYSATYLSTFWSGDLESYSMASDLGISTAPIWKASSYINPNALNSGTPPAWTTRRIVTFNDGLNAAGSADGATNGRQGVDFDYANLSARQKALLDFDPATLASDGAGSNRVSYLRGDVSNEALNGSGWRNRTSSECTDPANTTLCSNESMLGDFINSSPLYVRFPSSANVSPADYDTFHAYATTLFPAPVPPATSSTSWRKPLVYVGGNDGMLHVFNASDNADTGGTPGAISGQSGKEVFAYIPSPVYANLGQLTNPTYLHKYFVDGSPVAADVQLSDASWKTLIVGGLNAGGQGYYALDGTNPSNFASGTAKSLVKWEFTDRDDADLGYTFAQPLVRKMNNGKWAVIVGNGYNNTKEDGAVSSTGDAYLYILYVDGPGFETDGRGSLWTAGTNYVKIRLHASPPADSGTPVPPNGLSSVYGVDADYNGKLDYLYAGDRYGNLWKIDVTGSTAASWASAFGTVSDPLPLFTAKTADTTPVWQQITTSPYVLPHPKGGFMVLFGTGSAVDKTDNASPFSTSSFYGIWDKNDGTTVTRDDLQPQATLANVNVTTGTVTTTYMVQSNCQPNYSGTSSGGGTSSATCPEALPSLYNDGSDQQLGWVLDLHNDAGTTDIGEKYMSSVLPIVEGGLLTFETYTPPAALDICSGGGGYDTVYNLDYLTGGTFAEPVYYTRNATPTTAISVTASIGGSPVTVYPSGRKLSTAIGQNPKSIFFQADRGSSQPSTDTGCTDFVKGRPCVKDKYRCNIVTTAAGCENIIKSPATGRISWRQIVQ